MTSAFSSTGSVPPMETKARDLGRLIGQSSEYQAVKRANDGLMADRDAVALLNRMTELRGVAQPYLERDEEPPADVERELLDLMTRVQPLPSYQRMLVSQENFDKIMVQVNAWIAEGIRSGAASSIITLG
jgi:cell fate (sporulation/competence/biofilm development) regulator YlbF (YheA/YmcA/DUF963 family)